uniref:Malonyl-CoA:ACP transacylase (MAT) domain-containing protein n=1 Tax=Lotharella globosa TaxID=91324 RepID=A0A7S3ZET9_9EUKA
MDLTIGAVPLMYLPLDDAQSNKSSSRRNIVRATALICAVGLAGAAFFSIKDNCCGNGITQSTMQRPAAMMRGVLPRAALAGRAFRPSSFNRRSVRGFADVMSASDMIAADAFDPPSQKTAFMFPGQGAQFVGMGAALAEEVPEAKEYFDKASEILGYDLLQLCKEGPKEKLDATDVSQPAIFVSSMAGIEKLKKDKGAGIVDDATVAMGLSLGEYSALCFAGAISFEDGVRLVQERGAAMQAAADMTKSSMASVIGLDSEKVSELCKAASEQSGKPVQIANYLCKGNYAVSGDAEAIDKVMEIAKPDFKARMAVKLAVAGAFHTDFMKPAVERLQNMLDKVEVKEPRIPVVSNVDGKAHKDPKVIKEILKQQVTSPVLWENTMAAMLESDFEQAYEIGPGKVLAGILKRFDKKAQIENIEV